MVTQPPAVVVGLDQSPAGEAALRFAVGVAHRRHLPLRLVHTFEASHHAIPAPQGSPFAAQDAAFNAAMRLVNETVDVMKVAQPDLDVWTRFESGPAARVLLEESGGAELIVLGSRGSGRLNEQIVGSTTMRVASLSRCPVIAVPAAADRRVSRHRVVVGIDGSEPSEAAVGFAFHLASDLGEDLVAVHAWPDATRRQPGAPLPQVDDPAFVEDEDGIEMTESTAGWSEKFPDVRVEHRVIRDQPVRVLVAAGDNARLLVVGSRGRGASRGSLLGSVSSGVLQHASGPVAVVHQHAR